MRYGTSTSGEFSLQGISADSDHTSMLTHVFVCKCNASVRDHHTLSNSPDNLNKGYHLLDIYG